MCPRPQQVSVGLAHPKSANWKTAAERLGHRHPVRKKTSRTLSARSTRSRLLRRFVFENPLKALKAATAEMAALHFIHEEQEFIFSTQLPKADQVLGRGGVETAFALYAFDQNG